MSGSANIPYIQEESLTGVTAIEISCEDCGLVIEGDPSLTDQLQLVAEPSANHPELSRVDDTLRVRQIDRYRGSAAPVLRVPIERLPALYAKHARGEVKIERVNADVSYQLASGNMQLHQTRGAFDLRLARGQVQLYQHEGRLRSDVARGAVTLERCSGALVVNAARGDVRSTDCGGSLQTTAASGDVLVRHPNALQLRVTSAKGDVLVRSGTLGAAEVKVTKGDIIVSSRLLLGRDAPAEAAPDEPADFDAPSETDFPLPPLPPLPPPPPESSWWSGEDVSFNLAALGGIEFEAGEEGMRVQRGGRDIFRAGPEGIRVGRDISVGPEGIRVGKDVYVGPEGVRVGRSDDEPAPLQPGRFSFVSTAGDVVVDVPNDVPVRTELLITSGDVSSDIPLVEVGRPGPRGVVRRYVGATDGAEEERILVRLKSDRGDLRLRSVPMPPADSSASVARQAPTTPSAATVPAGRGSESVRIILEALARGDLSPREAEVLLDAIKDG